MNYRCKGPTEPMLVLNRKEMAQASLNLALDKPPLDHPHPPLRFTLRQLYHNVVKIRNMSSAINNAALPVIKTLLGKGVMRAAAYPSNLAQLLANLPRDGVGSRVVPESWVAQGITDSFYTITHVRLSPVSAWIITICLQSAFLSCMYSIGHDSGHIFWSEDMARYAYTCA